ATSVLLATAEPVGIATGLALHLAATGQVKFFKDSLDELNETTTGQVTDLAYKYLRRDRAVSLFMEPENEQAAKLVGGGGGGAAATTTAICSRSAGASTGSRG